ncbi:hypothetical protein ACJH6J_07100 [Mycobacterium sp. SMC-18]|uniref:hypothetical protein n=1 Tax=Mycobacterium sp. SMC-18 TaxID=3381629 RepID=UPI003875DA31
MTEAVAQVAIAAAVESEDDRWLRWLKANVQTGWRPGEWQHDRWLFSGDPDNPATTVTRCVVMACGRLISAGRICHTCNKILKQSGQDPTTFAATHRPSFAKGSPNDFDTRPQCSITRHGERCPLTAVADGPCAWHRHKFHMRKRREPGLTLDEWVQRTIHTIPTLSEIASRGVVDFGSGVVHAL